MKHTFIILLFILCLGFTPAHAMPMPSNGAPDQALLAAIQKGDLNALEAAFSIGAYPNVVTSDGCSALAHASKLNSPSIVQALLNKGADVNYSHETCEAPIYQAVKGGNLEILKLLLQKGIKMDEEVNGRSPLHSAVSSRKTNIVKFYLENGGDPNKIYDAGRSILMYASSRSSPGIVWVLLEHGADIKAQDNNGETALMMAARSGNAEIIQLLLENGAIASTKNKQGKTALMIAQGSGINHAGTDRESKVIGLLKNAESKTEWGNVNPFKEKPQFRPYRLIENAEKYGAQEQFKLAETYYYGLEDTPRNLTEAYYWFSICDYNTQIKGINSQADIYKITQEFSKKAGPNGRLSAEDQKSLMNLMAAPELNKMCKAYLSKMPQELSATERSLILARLTEWKIKNPQPTYAFSSTSIINDSAEPKFNNVKTRMDDLIPLANAGDKKAQYELGRCYNSHICEEPVADLQRKLAHHAQQELAQEGKSSKTFSGLDTRAEYKQNAIAWLEKSAAQSYGPAYTLLASMYGIQKSEDDITNLKKSCEMLLAAINAGDFHAYSLVAYMPWNRQTDRKIEEYAWTTVSKVAAGEKIPVEISPYMLKNLSDTELKTAQERARLYIREHVELKKPVCSPADL